LADAHAFYSFNFKVLDEHAALTSGVFFFSITPMSKAFTKEGDGDEPEDDFEEPDSIPEGTKNLMTPEGYAVLAEELRFLLREERPRITEIVSWAAGNGDRSENGDYLYNKKRLREIDRRIRYLTKRTESAEVVDPKQQQGIEQVFFGATVTYARSDDSEVTVKLVGVDEADMDHGKINWLSPVARALMKARVGDTVEVKVEGSREKLEIINIAYLTGESAR
jgi:transcription elongation factor GreB